tara:strand:+ start:1414 stop:1713 length:300 start_codon:yes stop_codon:yes gene_type:complete
MPEEVKKIQEIITRIPYLAAENAFVFVVGLVLLAIILSGFLFYQYGYLVVRQEPISQSELEFKQEVFQGILDEWKEREKASLDVKASNPRNIFQSKSID